MSSGWGQPVGEKCKVECGDKGVEDPVSSRRCVVRRVVVSLDLTVFHVKMPLFIFHDSS